jgi:hypothetical protein
MAETPDFEQIGRDLVPDGPIADGAVFRHVVIEAVTMAWNARGKADIDAAVTRMSTLVGWASSEPYLKQIREAIAALDR